MSGAYGNRFLAPGFCWHLEGRVRKMFINQQQADAYFRGQDFAAKGRFLAARPLWERALGADVAPLDPFRKNELVEIGSDPEWHEQLELTAPPSAAVLAALRAAAPAFEGDGKADFRNPVAAVRWGETFGLYVGLTAGCTADVAAPLERRFKSVLDALWPIAEAKIRELGLKEPVAKALRKLDPVKAFNPWGPLSDERFMRESCNIGSVDVRIAFVPVREERYFLAEWFGPYFSGGITA